MSLKIFWNNPKFWSWFMVKLPLTKIDKSWKTAIFFFFTIVVAKLFWMLLVVPLTKEYKEIGIITTWSFFLLIMIAFIFGWIFDPGYLKSDPKISFQYLLQNVDPYNLWPECKVIRTPRSRHWNICNRWVERFDHHWPYLNNCIGYNNHRWFLFFIFSIAINLIYHLALVIYTLLTGNPNNDWWDFMIDYYPNYLYYGFSGILRSFYYIM